MKINGKDIGFAYTIGAYCDINDYVVANPDVSMATANLHKAVIMSRAYNDMNGTTDTITVEELRLLQMSELQQLLDEMKAAEQAGMKRTVETKEKKQKNEVKT